MLAAILNVVMILMQTGALPLGRSLVYYRGGELEPQIGSLTIHNRDLP